MSKKNKKNKTNQNTSKINTQKIKVITTPQKNKTQKKEFPIYIFSILYFVLMACFCFFVLYMGEYDFSNTLTTLLFIGYFVSSILFAKIKKHSWTTAIKVPTKILCLIVGFSFFINFLSVGITYFSEANLQSQELYDIENYTTKVLTHENIDVYASVENSLIYVVNNDSELNKITQYKLYPENNFDIETIDMTYVFYPLSDNLKFSYIKNNFYNEIVLQLTNNDERYLATIPAEHLVDLLEEKDGYKEPFLTSDKLRIYKTENPNMILAVSENNVQFTEYDAITDTENLSYIERIHTFLVNHFELDYITELNASAEIIAEKYHNNYKLNLYNIGCATCEYKYGESEIMEIVNGNKSYIFNLAIDSETFKEAIFSE